MACPLKASRLTSFAASTSIALAKAGSESVCVSIPRKRTINLLLLPVITNRLRDRQNVPLIELAVESGSPMASSTKNNSLPGVVRIRPQCVVGGHELRDIY